MSEMSNQNENALTRPNSRKKSLCWLDVQLIELSNPALVGIFIALVLSDIPTVIEIFVLGLLSTEYIYALVFIALILIPICYFLVFYSTKVAEYKKRIEVTYRHDKQAVKSTLGVYIVKIIENSRVAKDQASQEDKDQASQENIANADKKREQATAIDFGRVLKKYRRCLIVGLVLYIFLLLLIGSHYVTQDAIQAKGANYLQNQLTIYAGALETLENRQEQLHKDIMTLLVEKQASSEKQLSQKVTQVSEDITLIKSALENINSELLQKKAAVILQTNKELQNSTNK